MIKIEKSIIVRRSLDEVFRYVSRFDNIEQWDPGVISAAKITPGPVDVDSEFQLTCAFMGIPFPMHYRITALTPPNRITLEGRGDTIIARDTISFETVRTGVRIRYALDLEFASANSLIETLMRKYIDHIGNQAVRGLLQSFRPVTHPPRMHWLDRWMDKAVLPGALLFSKYGYQWSKKFWNPMTASLHGRTVVVTGATSGLGRSAALECARLGARTIIVGRNAEKLDAAASEIENETGNPQIQAEMADLSIKADIFALAKRLDRNEPQIHVLINNAGALFDGRRHTRDGIERSLALNLMSPFLLTSLLLPKLKASTPARIINVSSGGMYTHALSVDDLAYSKQPYDGVKAYALAKRALVVLTRIWAKRWAKYGLTVNAMHPGWVDTPGIEKALPGFHHLTRRILRTPAQGADTIVWLAAAPEAALSTGGFWLDRRLHPTCVFPGTRESEQDRVQLVRELERLAGIEMAC